MHKKLGIENFLLLAIVLFSFTYRLILTNFATFPPGSDIGLHESVINSLIAGKTNFFWNYYHMGSGFSITNPGYHIFVSYLLLLTRMPDYLAQSLVASLFSSLTVLCAFLFGRQFCSKSVAIVVAFLACFSAGDLSILSWSGYPNIVTLMLIPLIFYLLVKTEVLSKGSRIGTASLLVGALFLTHVFSGLVFSLILTLTLLTGVFLSKKIRFSKSELLTWSLPVILGFSVVSPYVLNVLPSYFGEAGAITGLVLEMKTAIMETRTVSLEVLFLSIVPVLLFLLLTKLLKRKFLTFSSILVAVWIMIPALLTQSSFFGIYLDFERFVYFIYLPVILCVGFFFFFGADYVGRKIFGDIAEKKGTYSQIGHRYTENFRLGRIRKLFTVVFLTIVLVASIFLVPLFASPNSALQNARFYQVMSPAKYEATQWIKSNTPLDSICVADANYGWWISGFAQRPTLSAVDPQYLILSREFGPAEIAADLLNSNYYLNNGLLQVLVKGSFDGGKEYQFSSLENASFVPYPFLSLSEFETSVVYRRDEVPMHLNFSKIPVDTVRVENESSKIIWETKREDMNLVLTERMILYMGVGFAEVSVGMQSKLSDTKLDWLHIPFRSNGLPLESFESFATIDRVGGGLSQIVLPKGQLNSSVFVEQNPDFFDLVFSLEGKSESRATFFVGFNRHSPQSNELEDYFSLFESGSKSYFKNEGSFPLRVFDYQRMIRDWNVSYIVVRDEPPLRFVQDSSFSLAFKNNEVAVFKVRDKT